MAKSPTAWSKNPSAEANEYSYDSASLTYDSDEINYDGVVEGDMSDRDVSPTEWSTQSKTPTSWEES